MSHRVGFLVGPGVLGHLDGLHCAAQRLGVAVVNTWGAKGVFRWDSPFHAGTAGLQARDFDLAGLGAVDVLVASGLDPDEVTSTPWTGRAEVVDVEPADLARWSETWPHEPSTPTPPALYTELSAVIMPMYADPASPPARARALAESLPAGGAVVAEPGPAGFWVARALPTTVPGSVVVPARAEPRAAADRAAALAASGRHVTYVCADPPGSPPHDGIDVVVWDDVDLALPEALVEVAGPVVAWPELAGGWRGTRDDR